MGELQQFVAELQREGSAVAEACPLAPRTLQCLRLKDRRFSEASTVAPSRAGTLDSMPLEV